MVGPAVLGVPISGGLVAWLLGDFILKMSSKQQEGHHEDSITTAVLLQVDVPLEL